MGNQFPVFTHLELFFLQFFENILCNSFFSLSLDMELEQLTNSNLSR